MNQANIHAFAQGKTSNSQRLHRDLYEEVQGVYRLPSQMTCSVFRQVGATYKGLWTKGTRTWRHARQAVRESASRGWTRRPRYDAPTLTYVHGRDFTFKATGKVSVLTLSGRLILHYQGYAKHVDWLQHGAAIGGAKLWYDRAKRWFYLLMSITIDTPDPTTVSRVVGIDLCQRYLATVTTEDDHTRFYTFS